jgi:predicted transcriptional regulator
MTDEADYRAAELAGLTADLVAAYVSNNPLPAAALPDLIASVHLSLSGLGSPTEPVSETKAPAVNPKKSVFPDYIICLEDGKRFKSLKRHLGVRYSLTPGAYRAKWNLPSDYPMIAPNYAAQRSALAKASGLGRKADAEKTPVKKAPAKRKA